MANTSDNRGGGPRSLSRTDVALLAMTAAVALVHVAYYFPRVVDDLFISLRYAENFAHGRGAVYNLGERVEGYSSPLWMVLQSLGYALHLEGVTWTKVLGVLSLLGLQASLFRLCREVLSVQGPLSHLPGLMAGCNSYVVNWTVLGLETPVHLALLVFAMVALHRAVEAPDRGARVVAIAALVGLGTSRPESPLYLALIGLSPLLGVRRRAELAPTLRALARVLLPVGIGLAALLALRFLYYGHVVPNTYFVKGQGEHFDTTRLAALWAEGATRSETALYLGGTALLVAFAAPRRAAGPALVALACLYFTASVRLDWMPSLRHLLPVTVLAPVGYALLGDAFSRKWQPLWPLFSVLAAVIPGLAAASILPIDNRNSPEESRGRGWIRPKTAAKWQDTLLAYRRVEPPHVKRMGTYDMGQITQAWHVLETSAEPVERSWYVGRDIGAVGYYTGVRVFDTAGLFTPAASLSAKWALHHEVSDDLIRAAIALHPLALDLYEGWGGALGRNPPLLRNFKVTRGSPRYPVFAVATDRQPPSHGEIVRRYRAMVARFPKLFHLHTLYGESVGAVVEKRLRWVEANSGR